MSEVGYVDRVRFARALRSRPFALLWAGQTISALGDGAYTTALAWAVLALTGSATAMGVVVLARTAPMLLFLLVGGVAADRLPRRLVMLASDAGRAIAVLAIASLGWFGLLQLWHLIVLSFLFGIVSGFFMPAYMSIAPELVPVESLPSANSLTGLSRQMTTVLGPLVGAALVAGAGPQGAFFFDGLTFIVSALFLLALRIPSERGRAARAAEGGLPVRRGVRGVVADLREGLRYVMASSWIWVTILIASVINMVASGAQAVALPKLVTGFYHADVKLYSLIATAGGLGAVVAMVVIGQAPRLHHRGILAYVASLFSAVALAAFGLPFPLDARPVIALVASFIFGLGIGVFSIIWDTVLQELVPPEKLGRVSSLDMLGSFALLPVGLLAAGVLADQIGPALVFVLAGVAMLALNVVGLTVRGIRKLD